MIKNVHQRHASRFRGLAVIHHHLNAQGPQSHGGSHGHQGGGPIRSLKQDRGQLQAVQGEPQTGPAQAGHQPPQQQHGFAKPAGWLYRQPEAGGELTGFRTDRKCCAEREIRIEIAIHLRGEHQMVVEAIEEGSIAGLGIAPKPVEGFLVRQTCQVVEGFPHRLGGHRMEQGLQPNGAVHRDHPTAGAQVATEGAVMEVMHPTCDAVLLGEQQDQ